MKKGIDRVGKTKSWRRRIVRQTLVGGIVLAVLCSSLYVSVARGSNTNKILQFIKLLNRAEYYFLNRDYDEANRALSEAQEILKEQRTVVERIEPFFDLSSPENTVRSFYESALLGNKEKGRACWSKRVPRVLVVAMVTATETLREEMEREVPELADPEMLKLLIETMGYEREWAGMNSYWVWAIPPGYTRSKDMQYKVIRENNSWKILTIAVWEEEEFLKLED